MVIDFHTHTFPSQIAEATLKKLGGVAHIAPFTDGTADGLLSSMKAAGADLSIVLPVATSARQVPGINRSAVELNEVCFQKGVLSFGCIHPDYPQWKEELGHIAQWGLKGIKIHPPYQGTDLDHPHYLRILERAGELGLIVVTHAGVDIGLPNALHSSPAMLRRALAAAGPVKLVAAHMGGWQCWDEAMELLADTSVYLDTSFSHGPLVSWDTGHYAPEDQLLLSHERFVDMVHAFGAHRILFGTDSPWTGQKESLAWLRSLPLSPEELAAILGENAKKLLNI